jgi:hypothetical protein
MIHDAKKKIHPQGLWCPSFSKFIQLMIQITIMLSRFSVLFVYIVACLAISAAATPMGPSRHYDGSSKRY